MAERASGSATRIRAKQPSLLAGLIYDGLNRPMTPSHATKGSRRYRYYVTRPDLLDTGPAWRIPAHDVEAIVCGRLAELLCDRMRLHDLVANHSKDAQSIQRAIQSGDLAAATLRSGSAAERTRLCRAMIQRVALDQHQVGVVIETGRLLTNLGADDIDAPEPIILDCAAVRIRSGHELRLVIPSPASPAGPAARDEKLVALIAEAQTARALVMAAPDRSLNRIAADAGRCRTRLGKLVALSCIAPDIVSAIVEGRQPVSLTAAALSRADLPLSWSGQRAVLGFS